MPAADELDEAKEDIVPVIVTQEGERLIVNGTSIGI